MLKGILHKFIIKLFFFSCNFSNFIVDENINRSAFGLPPAVITIVYCAKNNDVSL